MSLDRLEFDVTLTPRDWAALLQEIGRQATPPRAQWAVLIGVAAVTGFLLALLDWLGVTTSLPSILAAVGLWSIGMWIAARMRGQHWAPEPDGTYLAPHQLELSAEGIRVTSARSQSSLAWSLVRKVSTTAEHVFLWVDKVSAIQIPIRALPSQVALADVLSQLDEWRGVGGSTSAPVSLSATPAAEPVARAPWLSDAAIIPLLGAAAVAILLGLDFWSAQPNPNWYGSGVGGIAWFLLGAIGLAGVLHLFNSEALPFRRVLRFVFEPLPLLALLGGYAARDTFVYPSWTPLALGVMAVAGYAVWRMRRSLSAAWLPAGSAGMAYGFLFAIVTSSAGLTTRNWYSESLLEQDDAVADITEDRLHFDQAQKVDKALAALAPRVANQPNLFVVGFAGYGSERVFAEEVRFATQAIGAKWPAASRTLLLLNDRRNLEAHPLASAAALERALLGIGARMDPEQDVLLLFLSSHGSEDATLSVENLYRTFEPLSSSILAEALERSGIRRRVVIISACHSGSFIPALRNPDTIVLTAAAKDRTSFGCSDERDLTYFGEALFRDALPKAPSLRSAFEQARSAITVREKKEKHEPSRPQAWFGSEMDRYWTTHFEQPATN